MLFCLDPDPLAVLGHGVALSVEYREEAWMQLSEQGTQFQFFVLKWVHRVVQWVGWVVGCAKAGSDFN